MRYVKPCLCLFVALVGVLLSEGRGQTPLGTAFSYRGQLKLAGVPGLDFGADITVGAFGNAYVTGVFSQSANFGSFKFPVTLNSAGESDIFVARYHPSGKLVWAKRAGGLDVDDGLGITVDAFFNSYVTGFFGGTATFGPGEANETDLTSAGFSDIFVVKYKDAGFSGFCHFGVQGARPCWAIPLFRG